MIFSQVLGYEPPQLLAKPQKPQNKVDKKPGEMDWSSMGPVGKLMGALQPSPEQKKQQDANNRALVSGLFGGSLDGVMDKACKLRKFK